MIWRKRRGISFFFLVFLIQLPRPNISRNCVVLKNVSEQRKLQESTDLEGLKLRNFRPGLSMITFFVSDQKIREKKKRDGKYLVCLERK